MSVPQQGSAAPPAGGAANWYPDPYGQGRLRYFDGTQWTEHVNNDGGDAPPQQAATGVMIISTMNDLPGYEVVEVYGEVFGLIVRARNAFSNIGASFRTVFGGEAKGYTKLIHDSRLEAVERLKASAAERGANAVIAMRFDCNEIADIMSEVAAYGTAVKVRKL
ncbi:MAG TPA: heavy metal-binding domain-containing protein [Solirubrobacteraceae bacterium]|nr:heavy metal-binding domain-containing protein [Solirubrobacteraceae bacterium]